MNLKHYSIYPFKKQMITSKCKNSCVRRDVCKNPKRASIPSFFGYVAQNLGGGENSALIFWSCVEKWPFLMLENDRILVLENERFLVLENDRHPGEFTIWNQPSNSTMSSALTALAAAPGVPNLMKTSELIWIECAISPQHKQIKNSCVIEYWR